MGDCMNMFMNDIKTLFLYESLIKVDILKSENDLVANQRYSNYKRTCDTLLYQNIN